VSFQDFECYLIAVMRHLTLTYRYLRKGITSPKLMLAWILRKRGRLLPSEVVLHGSPVRPPNQVSSACSGREPSGIVTALFV